MTRHGHHILILKLPAALARYIELSQCWRMEGAVDAATKSLAKAMAPVPEFWPSSLFSQLNAFFPKVTLPVNDAK